jgi:hypothetical protein
MRSVALSGWWTLCCLFSLHTLYAQTPSMAFQRSVRPGDESGVLTRSIRSRLVGDYRLVGRGGSVEYSFRVLSGMDVQIQWTAGGTGRVRVRSGERGLAVREIKGRVQTSTLTLRTPLQPALQTLTITVEAGRRGQVLFYGLRLQASQRDEDGDGIGDGTERLLGAPANALTPVVPPRADAPTLLPSTWFLTPAPIGGEYQIDPFSLAYWYGSTMTGGVDRSAATSDGEPRGQSVLALDPQLARDDINLYLRALVGLLIASNARITVGLEPLGSPPLSLSTMALLGSAARAVEEMMSHKSAQLDAGVEGVGLLVPMSSEEVALRELWAVSLPLVRSGVPLQNVPMARLADGLRSVRLLIWTPEAGAPRDAELELLASWVRRGGWLLVVGSPFGGSSAEPTPLHALGARLGLTMEMASVDAGSDASLSGSPAWQELARSGTSPQESSSMRRWVSLDLSPYAGQTVYVRLRDSLPDGDASARLRQLRLEADGRVMTAFYVGTSIERLFLYAHDRSRLSAEGERIVDGTAWVVYRFTLPNASRITLHAELAQEWLIERSDQPPYAERVLARGRSDLPPLVLRHDEHLAHYNLTGGETLYTYGDSADRSLTVGVLRAVERGGVVLVGVSARAFSNSPNGESHWRQLVRFVAGRAGLRYRERARFTLQRGEWVAAYGTYRTTILRGTYLDALDPRLPLLTDVPLDPQTPRLLLRVDNRLQRAGLLHTNAQVVLQHTTPTMVGYLLRGADGVPGVARIALRGLKGTVQMLDGLGNPVPVNVERTGETLLIRWNMSQSGHVLLVR